MLMTSFFLRMQMLTYAMFFLIYFPNFVKFRVRFVVPLNPSFFFSSNTPINIQSQIASQVEMPIVTNLGKYLRMPFLTKRKTTSDFQLEEEKKYIYDGYKKDRPFVDSRI